MSTLVQRIQDLVKRDKMEQALKELEIWAAKNDADLHNMVILQTARFNQLRRGERMGIMSRDEAYRTGNQIRYSVLSILEDLPEVLVDTAVNSSSDTVSNSTPTDSSPRARKLFISYAREDRPYVEALEVHLAALRNSGHIDSWSDSKILPGQEWSKAIEDQVRAADIILYMVSASFINSKFINEHEKVWANEARANGRTIIVPVIVRPSDWEGQDFAQYHAIPRHPESSTLTPISKWQDKDEAYLTVVKSLRRIIESAL